MLKRGFKENADVRRTNIAFLEKMTTFVKNHIVMKRIFTVFSAALVLLSAAVSCEEIDDALAHDDDEEVNGGNNGTTGGNEDEFSDYLIAVGAEGMTDENMLQYCVNMTHQFRYEITGLEDCTWARVRHVQNQDGNDWTPLLTVDPNETGKTRTVKIEISLAEPSWHCEHEISQASNTITYVE